MCKQWRLSPEGGRKRLWESRKQRDDSGTSGARWLRGTWLDLRWQKWPRTRTRPCGSKRASSGRSGSGLPPRFPAGCPGCGWRPGWALGGQCSKGGLGHVAAGEAGRVLARQADPKSAERSDWPRAAPASFSAGEEGSGFWRRPTSLAHRAAVGGEAPISACPERRAGGGSPGWLCQGAKGRGQQWPGANGASFSSFHSCLH